MGPFVAPFPRTHSVPSMERACRIFGRSATDYSVGSAVGSRANHFDRGAMQLHPHSKASADTKRPEPTAAERPLSTRLSIPRAAMNDLLVPLPAHHHALRCHGLASSTFVRSHDELPAASFSHTAYRHEHGLTFSRSRRMRSMLRAVRILPGNSATADRSFFPDRYCSLWRSLRPVRRCADRKRSGPP